MTHRPDPRQCTASQMGTRIRRRKFLKTGIGVATGAVALGIDTAQGQLLDDSDAVISRPDDETGPVMLDTEALIWVDQDDDRLGSRSGKLVDVALSRGELYVSSVSFWEVFSLAQKQHIEMDLSVSDWRGDLLDAGVHELGVDGIIGIPEDDKLDGEYFHGAALSIKLRPLLATPRDQLISTPPHLLGSLVVASALRLRATLITTDQNLLQWSSDEIMLNREDART